MVEEWVEIGIHKLGEEEWEIKLKGTIPPLDSKTVRELKEAVGDIGDLKIDADGLVVGRVVGNVNQILDRLGKAVFGKTIPEHVLEEIWKDIPIEARPARILGRVSKLVKEGEKRVEEARGEFEAAVEKVQSPLPALIGPAGHLVWLKARAKAIKPYPRLGTAWVNESYKDRKWTGLDPFEKKYAVICSVRFGACGYQDADYGLTIELKSEDGWHTKWSFYSMEDIYELMHRTRAHSLKALVGKPMFVYIFGFNTVAGVDVNDALIL